MSDNTVTYVAKPRFDRFTRRIRRRAIAGG
jgi:hypothetical protein